MIHHVFHRALPLAVERMENTVIDPVELQRRHIEQLTQLLVERRRRLDPAAVQIKLGVAVHGEHITFEQRNQARRRQMIAHVRQADARRNAAVPRTGGEQGGLGHAIAFASRQGEAGVQGAWVAAEGVGVVAHRLPYGVIQGDCLVT